MFRFFLLICFVLVPLSANAALKKQCKPQIYVDAQVPVLPVGVIIPPDAAKKAKNAASYRAQKKWVTWASATHGQAYANPRLANRYKISCQINGNPPKSALCSVRGVPCRVNNAPSPGRVLNRVPNPVLKRTN